MRGDWDRSALCAALAGVARGEEPALKDVYERTSAKLFGVCLRILKNESEAEDVLQEVYLTVWRKASAFDESKASPVTWLAAMARNRAIDRLRSGASRGRETDVYELALPDPAPSAQKTLEVSQELQQLEHCLSELEPVHATAVRTAFFGGVTYEALAAQMETPLGTVKGWIRRSLMKLKACLEA
jgi:RNA polymerase sigma factor (sigma-70 family)